MKKFLFALTIVLITISAGNILAAEYYISSSGDDSADGLSPATSFRTIDKVNELRLQPGDKLLFKSGDRFVGTLRVKSSGDKDNPVIVTSYGGDEQPVFSGSMAITGIKSLGGNLYEAPCTKPVENLFLNGKLMIIAREPNSGFFTMEGGGIDYLVDTDLKLPRKVIEGARVRLRSTDWSYEYRNAVGFSDYTIKFDSMLFHTSFKNYYCKAGYGYYLDNKKEFLDIPNEWYWSEKDKKVYFISNVEPDKMQLRGSYVENGVVLAENVSNVRFQGIKIEDYTGNGIQAEGLNNDVQITNCSVVNIGVVGIFFKNRGVNLVISNNELRDITGSGIRLIAAQNSFVENNRVKNIGLIAGYGVNSINGAIGVSIESVEELGNRYEQITRNNMIRNNYIDSTGYMCARMDGINNIFEKNILKNGLFTMNDGGLLHTYGVDISEGINMEYTYDNIIRGNIFANCIGNSESSGHDFLINHGIYLDARSNRFIVEDNIVINTGTGILLNDKNRKHIVRNNTCYGNEAEMGIAQSKKLGDLEHEVIGNVFFNTYNRQSTLSLSCHRGVRIEPGRIDSNYYLSPKERFHVKRITVDKNWKTTREYTLEGWQEMSGQDQNSVFVEPQKDGVEYVKSKIFINEGDVDKTIELDPEMIYMDIDKNDITDKIVLPPRTCKILMYTKK